MKIVFASAYCFLGVSTLLLSQNLFQNPDFESFTAIPLVEASFEELDSWDRVCFTPDFLHVDGFPFQNPFWSDFFPDEGDGAIFMASGFFDEKLEEAVGQQLAQPLQAGGLYKFSLDMMLQGSATGSGAIRVYGLESPPVLDPDNTFSASEGLAGAELLFEIGQIGSRNLYTTYTACFKPIKSYQYLVIAAHLQLVFADNAALELVLSAEEQQDILGPDTLACAEDGFSLTIPPFVDEAQWENGDTITLRPIPSSGLYSIEAVSNGCLLEDTIAVAIEFCIPPSLFIPNAFSPNDDGINDYFEVYSNYSFKEFELQIYDRWGSQVFRSSDPSSFWNGEINGANANIGTYLVCLKYRLNGDPSGSMRVETSDLFLLR
ncbi:MAG: gliding motility-associated C-terminal domain-containing protein [Bacteroidota bacterium]